MIGLNLEYSIFEQLSFSTSIHIYSKNHIQFEMEANEAIYYESMGI